MWTDATRLDAQPQVSWTQPTSETLDAPEGHAWLKWQTDEAVDAFLIERVSPDETIVREIVEPATFIAGLPQGISEVRVRALRGEDRGPWSSTLKIQVEYPSLYKVKILGALGIFLFFATAAMILLGHRTFEREDREREDRERGGETQ